MMGSMPQPSGLPPRFGYYVGYRIVQETRRPITTLARLGNEAARPIVRVAHVRLMVKARATCAPPASDAKITHAGPRTV